jgi:outer membrane protein assembly factor BamA
VAALGLGTLGRAAGQVEEGGLVVRSLKFRGNHSFEYIILAAAISTTTSSWFVTTPVVRWLGLGEKRRLNERQLRTDVERLRLFYRARGYLEVQVDTSVVRTPTDAYVTFIIQEGEPVLIAGSISRGWIPCRCSCAKTCSAICRCGKAARSTGR